MGSGALLVEQAAQGFAYTPENARILSNTLVEIHDILSKQLEPLLLPAAVFAGKLREPTWREPTFKELIDFYTDFGIKLRDVEVAIVTTIRNKGPSRYHSELFTLTESDPPLGTVQMTVSRYLQALKSMEGRFRGPREASHLVEQYSDDFARAMSRYSSGGTKTGAINAKIDELRQYL
jgi:hypothetical protein